MADTSTNQRSLARVIAELDARGPAGDGLKAGLPTGFEPLDESLGGGLRLHDLVLLGGVPGVGKTIAGLQWARHMASTGHDAIYACYEHDEAELLARLLLLEVASLETVDDDALLLADVRAAIAQVAEQQRTLWDASKEHFLLARARKAVEAYADRLWLVRASGRYTGVDELAALVAEHGGGRSALFVDYLQKVAAVSEPGDEAERVTAISAGLKDLALSHDVTVVALVAADQEGLQARRLHLHHLRGSSALAYESDVVLTLNEKMRAVSDVHLDFDSVRAEAFRDWAVLSVEKNRGGVNLINMEFQKDFSHYRFHPAGRFVAERLVDERVRE